MPNKFINYDMDVLPNSDGTYSLGNSSRKWKINDTTPGDVIGKNVDSSISASSTSTNVPTSQAVATYVEGNKITDAQIDALFA